MKKLVFFATLIAIECLGLPSTAQPTHVEKTTVIKLTSDIVISERGTPFIASESFGSQKKEKLIITSETKNKIIITSKAAWDLSSFNSKNKIIEFSGNAQLVCEPGARILFNNGVLRFAGSSRWIIG